MPSSTILRMVHDVTPETWAKLSALAAAAGQDLKAYIEAILRQHAESTR